MRTYATAQLIGDRTTQCDATAVYTAPSGARAYVLLDGIGSSDEVRAWTRDAARRLARAAARRGDAETGLRAVYNTYAADPARQGPWAHEQIDEIRTRLANPNLDAVELREIATTLLADNDAQYSEADYWREGYRITKGLTNDEIGAIIATRDAFQAHPRPCGFPHEACVCNNAAA